MCFYVAAVVKPLLGFQEQPPDNGTCYIIQPLLLGPLFRWRDVP